MVDIMDREELYRYFGPMLIEALVHLMLDEINILRKQLGLSLRTKEQVQTAIADKLSNLTCYDWMNRF